ncbi:MAG: DUF4418 family protein [Ruminobacter sp.]|nr:DUF4418 family protein [Ruminobacter sp.]
MVKRNIFSIVILILEAVLLAGMYTFWAPCPIGEHIMGCHWVANVSVAVSAVIIILSLVNLATKNSSTRKGIDMGILAVTILHGLIPQVLISICKHEHMRCHVYTQPAIISIASLVFVLIIADLFVNRNN